MKQTGLWSRLNRRYRAALRERMGEHGAAMMLAILFVMVVLTTSALVMTTLLAQAIPYKNNKENSQANYAAESGLEVGLSYINENLAKLQGSTSLDDLQKVLPAVDADMNDSSKDGEFVKYDGASVLLNHVALNKTVKTSDTASYTPDDLSYRVRINFYDTNPDDASAEMIGSPSDLKNLQYAEVVATGFINRYKDGRTAGNTKSPQAMKRAVCRIEAKTDSTTTNHSSALGIGGRMGMGFYAAAPYNRLDSQFVWVPVDYDGVSIGSDPTGEVKFSGTVDSGRTNTSQLSDGTATLNPVNRTCMLATTIPVTNEKKSIAENLDLSKSPQAGSGLVVLPAAYNAGGDTYQYTEECRADGAYSSLNTWVYYKDNSIRLASNMGLCVTGVSIDDTDGKTPATLQPCGTSYGVHFQGDYYTDPNKVAQQTEKNDPNSLLNKYQKWNFYNGFINAGYWNELTGDVSAQAASYDSALPESKGYAVAGVQNGKKTKFQRLEVTHYGGSPQDSGDPHFAGGNIKATPYSQAYMVSQWTYNFSDSYFSNGADMQDATASFSQAGEAGYGTNQMVNSASGFCMVMDGNDVYADTCDVHSADFDAKCYQKTIMGQGSDFISTSHCSTADKENFNFTSDRVSYTEDASADGTGIDTTIALHDTNGNAKYLHVSGSKVSLTDNPSDATKFRRYNEHNTSKAVSYGGKTQYPWAGTFQTSEGMCLTEIYPGDYVESNGKKDRQYNRSDGHSMLKMVSCGTDRDVRGRLVKSQAWNASVNYGDAGSAGSITWTTTTTTVSIPTSTYFSAVVDSTVTSRKW